MSTASCTHHTPTCTTPSTLACACSVWQTKPHFSRMFTLSCTHCAPRCTCALAHGCTHRVCERESERRKRERKTKMKVLEPTCTSRVPFLSLSFPSLSLYLSFSHPRFPSVFFSLSFSLALSFSLSPFLSRPRECVNTCSYVWHDSLVGTSHRPWAPKCTHSAYFTWHDLFVWIT